MQGDQVMAAGAGGAIQPVQALPKRAWARWRQAAHAVGVVQTRLLMLLVYLVVVVPTGLLARLARDPLHIRPPAQGNWTAVEHEELTVERARQQF